MLILGSAFAAVVLLLFTVWCSWLDCCGVFGGRFLVLWVRYFLICACVCVLFVRLWVTVWVMCCAALVGFVSFSILGWFTGLILVAAFDFGCLLLGCDWLV